MGQGRAKKLRTKKLRVPYTYVHRVTISLDEHVQHDQKVTSVCLNDASTYRCCHKISYVTWGEGFIFISFNSFVLVGKNKGFLQILLNIHNSEYKKLIDSFRIFIKNWVWVMYGWFSDVCSNHNSAHDSSTRRRSRSRHVLKNFKIM